MAKTFISYGLSTGSIGAGLTRFVPVNSGGGSHEGTESNIERTERLGGTYSFLTVNIGTNAAVDGTTTFRFRKNTANGNQVVSFAAGETGRKIDATNTDAVAVGDNIALSGTNTASAGSITPNNYSTIFDATSNTVQWYTLNQTAAVIGFGVNNYFGLSGDSTSTVQANFEIRVGTAGTFKRLGTRVTANNTDGNSVFTFINGGVNGNVTITYAAAETGVKEDVTNTDVVAVNDLVAIKLNTTASTSGTIGIRSIWLGLETTNNKTDYVCAAHSTRTAANTRFYAFIGVRGNSPTESGQQFYPNIGVTLSNLRVFVSASNWSSDSTTRLRINAANGNSVVTVPMASTGWFADAVNSDVIAIGDLINYSNTLDAGVNSVTYENFVMTGEVIFAPSGGSTLLMMGVG